MTKASKILIEKSHRPYEIPSGSWKYYQEWNNALFLHWEVPLESLRNLVPNGLEIDSFEGKCYCSLVAFTMQKIRPKFLPAVSFISDFDEINLRTYVKKDNKQGVYFLNIEGGKTFSVLVAKFLSGLPYEKSSIKRNLNKYASANIPKAFKLDTEFIVRDKLTNKTALDKWLTERYCLYLNKGHKIYRYDIHHKEWEIKTVDIKRLNLTYKIGDIHLNNPTPALAHYSDGVKVIAWKRIKA